MPARSRTKDTRYLLIGQTVNPTTSQTFVFQTQAGVHVKTDDVTGNYPNDNPFLSVRQSQDVPTIGGTRGVGASMVVYSDVPLLEAWTMPAFPNGFLPVMNSTYLAQVMTEALAASNPQASDVDLPAFLGELRDFPGMSKEIAASLLKLRGAGKFLLKVATLQRLPEIVRDFGLSTLEQIAKGNLNWRFGIAPMIGDVTKMLKFSDGVNRRMRYLRKLRDGKKVLSRNVTLRGNGSMTLTSAMENISTRTGYSFRGPVSTTFRFKDWACVRWKSNGGATVIPEDESALRFLAARLNYGITSQSLLETAWELTPWSWLIDYFGNLGDYLKATNNSLGLIPGAMCLMRKTEAFQLLRVTNAPATITISGDGKRKFEQKSRTVIPTPVAVPLMSLPVLTTGQWSILGSLGVVRGTRALR